jgi:hypothetical protein
LRACRRLARSQSARPGVLSILVAISLIALLAFVAIVLDGGLLQENRRRAQGAADAAAGAAAAELFSNYAQLSGGLTPVYDPGDRATTAAQAAAATNGFTNDRTTSTVTVNIPPKSGPFTDKLGYAEVIVTYYQPRYFSTIWGSARLPVQARAVAFARWGGSGNGVIVLDPSAQNALDASGSGSVTVTGGAAMVVNSDHSSSAARATGGGMLKADRFRVTGNTNGTLTGTVQTGTPPIPDPLRLLPVPPVPPDGVMTQVSLEQGNKQYTLTPGRYTNLPAFNPGDVVILQQASAGNGGIYYIDGGGFKSTGASIIMDPTTSGGLMIYNAPRGTQSSEGINISGNSSGTVNLSPLTTGTYAGLVFWQERTSTVPMNINGQGTFTITGTFYAANALLQISGQGDATIGSQYISRTLSLSGGGNIIIDYSDSLTARQRDLYLVE